jgi:hypothetical protein
MMFTLTDLIAVLQGEVRVGEELLLNLAAQKEAILAWDSSALLQRVDEKEQLVRQLEAMEEKRQEVVSHLLHTQGRPLPDKSPSLKDLLAQLPLTPQTPILDSLRRQAWQIYSSLRVREKNLAGLTGTLLGHITEALRSVTPLPVSLYGEKGALSSSRPAPGLVQGKI